MEDTDSYFDWDAFPLLADTVSGDDDATLNPGATGGSDAAAATPAPIYQASHPPAANALLPPAPPPNHAPFLLAAASTRLYALPSNPPPGFDYLQAYPPPAAAGQVPNMFDNQNGWEGAVPMAGAGSTANWQGMPNFDWNGQPSYTAPAAAALPVNTPVTAYAQAPHGVPGEGMVPPLLQPQRAPTGLNVRYAPYPSAPRGPALHNAAGPVRRQRHQQDIGAPVVQPNIGSAAPRQSVTGWHNTYAETYLEGRSPSPTTMSAEHALGPTAQAFDNTSISPQQSHRAPRDNAAPGPSGSFAQPSAPLVPVAAPAPAPAAPVALQPPAFDYSNGQTHRCPVCVNDPEASAQLKKPLNAKGMALHYKRVHSGYAEAHGGHAQCVFCGVWRKIVRKSYFSSHRAQMKGGQKQCPKIVDLGGAEAYDAIYRFLVDAGVPLDHWQLAESRELVPRLRAIEARERANQGAPVAGTSRQAQADAVEEAGAETDADAEGSDYDE